MEIIVGKTSGFCEGVRYTVQKAYEVLKETDKKVYCLGEIVHNERVVEELSKNGMIFVNDLPEIPNNSKVIIRAHGEEKKTYDEIEKRGLELLDLTCGKIRIIRHRIIRENDASSFIVMIGKKNHPETNGTISFCKYGMIFESEEDINELEEKIKNAPVINIHILSQTTFSEELFEKLSSLIKERFEEDYKIIIDKTICNATHERQEETKELSQTVDLMIIIGGKNSSNTKELFEIANKNCKNAFLIQEEKDLDSIVSNNESFEEFLKNNDIKRIGIMAGASTNKEAIDEVYNKLKNINIIN